MMAQTYCYCGLATGVYGKLMEQCAASSREAGVYSEFHVLSDQALVGCESYDAMADNLNNPFFILPYLKAAISKLPFESFIWLHADTTFKHFPRDILGLLKKSPIHLPLRTPGPAGDKMEFEGQPASRYLELVREAGVRNDCYLPVPGLFIIRKTGIEIIYELACEFLQRCQREDVRFSQTAALGFAMQMVCGNPAPHLIDRQKVFGVAGEKSGGNAIVHQSVSRLERVPCADSLYENSTFQAV